MPEQMPLVPAKPALEQGEAAASPQARGQRERAQGVAAGEARLPPGAGAVVKPAPGQAMPALELAWSRSRLHRGQQGQLLRRAARPSRPI
jgi:hypothetical protein